MGEGLVKTCCFTGHRPKSLPWGYNEKDLRCVAFKSRMKYTLENLIVKDGYKKFISGMAMGADMICAEITLSLKILYPYIELECAVPNYAFTENWRDEDRDRFNNILERADNVTYVSDSEIYSKRDLMLRNIYMVDSSELVVAVYTDGESGGTRNTMDYAKSKGKEVLVVEP